MTTRKNCIHCHNIHDAEQEHAYDTGTFSQEMLWRYPLPDNIGLSIDGDDGIRIQEIADRSPAEAAGLEAGEDVVSMNGQPMTSIADMQWVLHHLPNEETTVQVTGSKTGEHSVELKAGWKKSDISWRASLYSVRPRLNVWMPPLPDDLRLRNKLGEDEAALLAKWINRGQPGGKAAFDAGLREGDIIIAIDGQPLPKQTPPELQMHIKLNYEVGDVLPMTVLRNGKKKELRIPLTK